VSEKTDPGEEAVEALARQLPEQIARVRSQVEAAKARLRQPLKDGEPDKKD
jgi:hypothetical protein